MRLKASIEMGDHIAQLEWQFSRLAGMSLIIEEQIKVAILLSSLSEQREYAPTIASVDTIHGEIVAWSYVARIF